MPAAYSSKSVPSRTSRFELPALKLDFGNITDGTSIPPPPPEPPVVVKTPVPTLAVKEVKRKEVGSPSNGASRTASGEAQPTTTSTNQNGKLAGTKRPASEAPLSPSLERRPGALRRLLSKTMLNNSYAEGEKQKPQPLLLNKTSVTGGIDRPTSRSGSTITAASKSKRSSGWFRRLRGDDYSYPPPSPASPSKRSSIIFEQATPTINKPSGPPPPMIPELRELEKDQGGFGSDLFKDIK